MNYRFVHTYNLIAFLCVLGAIVALSLLGQRDLAVITGLVGILGSFKPWGSAPSKDEGPSGTTADPVKTEIISTPDTPVNVTETKP
jgi:hypothetical protein